MPFLLDRKRMALWAGLYALGLIYASLVIGPIGFHFVPADPVSIWHKFLAVRYLDTSSDQRPDWMANLLALAPFAFLLTGAFTPSDGRLGGRGERRRRTVGAIMGLVLGFGFVLAVKYAQLFFPPRTVTLNYITAQGLGVLLGAGLFALGRDTLVTRLLHPLSLGGREGLIAALGAYAATLVYFTLEPFDVALSRGDWRARLAALPSLLLGLPHPERPALVRAVLVLAAVAAMAPIGVLLALAFPRRRLGWIGGAGLAIALGLTVLTLPIMSATPFLFAIPYRAAGVLAGAAAWRAMRPTWPERARTLARRLLVLLVPAYLLLLAAVNGILTHHWRTPAQALAALDWYGLLPLWQDYIVSKADAAKSTVVHIAMYAPIGVMVWLRAGGGRRAAWTAGVLAAMASLAVELGRWMKPGLQPDFNEVAIGGLAAWLTVRLAPAAWRLVTEAIAGGTIAARGATGDGASRPPGAREVSPPPGAREVSPPPGARDMSRPPDAAEAPSLPASSGPDRGRRSPGERSATVGGVRPGHDLEAGTAPTPSAPGGWRGARAGGAVLCLAALGGILLRYPLPAWPLALVLTVYGASLWRWPGLWLIVIPVVLPAFDLTMWTGWLMVSESDAFLLVTLAVLLWRAPPAWRDLWPRGVAGAVLALTALTLAVGVLRGLTSPHVLPGGSSDPYLLPINALRLAKGEVWAFVLLPFLRARERQAGDALVRLGWGMVAGLAAVSAAGILERALFPGVFNFHSFYRIAATFSSVQFGGDDIGTYLAMTPPFLAVALVRPRGGRSRWRLALVAPVAVAAAYALLVTYSRTAYGAAVIGALATAVLLLPMARARGVLAVGFAATLLALGAGAVLGFAADSRVMTARLSTVLPDFRTRLANWTGGLAMMDHDPVSLAFGMGLGTFPRVARVRAPLALKPSNDTIRHDADGRRYLRIASGSHFYFGQKVPVRPGRRYTLSLRFRDATPGARPGAVLCEKLLLYSEACVSPPLPPAPVGVWQAVRVPLSSAGLDRRVVLGVLRRPLELAVFATGPGQVVDFADVRLQDAAGRNLVRNGSFRDGTARWYPTDDSHLAWTIWNSYAITLFEGGSVGLVVWLLLGGVALWAAAAAALRGVPMAAPIAGSLAAFAAAGVFDNELTAPRMITLFYVVAMLGLDVIAGR